MAYNHNGQQPYYGYNTNPPNSQPTPYTGYTAYAQSGPPQDQTPLRRTASYDAGDDASFFDESRAQQQQQQQGGLQANAPNRGQSGQGGGRSGGVYSAYGSNGSATSGVNSMGSRRSQYSIEGSQQSAPSRASSQGSPYQTYHTPTPASPTSYNPQQFGRTHSQSLSSQPYNPSAYSAGGNPYGSPGPQPYNPAAYTATVGGGYSPNLPRQPTTASQPYARTPPSTYGLPSPLQPAHPPPPPPRPHGYYGERQPSHPSESSPEPQHSFSADTRTAVSYGSTSPRVAPARQYSQSSQYSSHTPNPPPHAEPVETPSQDSLGQRYSFSARMNSISTTSSSSLRGPLPTPPAAQTSPRRTDTLTRHPQSRPLPGPPSSESEIEAPEYFAAQNGASGHPSRRDEELTYEDLMREVEEAVNARSSGAQRQESRASRASRHDTIQEADELDEVPALFPNAANAAHLSPDERHTHTNGSMSTGTGEYINYAAYSDDSDAEAAAGLAMLQMADEQEAADRQRFGTNTTLYGASVPSQTEEDQRPPLREDPSSDSDYVPYDMGLYGGGYDAPMRYGADPNLDAASYQDASGRGGKAGTSGSQRSRTRSSETYSEEYDYPAPGEQVMMPPMPQYTMGARVDTGGTGGLSEPSPHPRRMSFDEGDEGGFAEHGSENQSDSQSPTRAEPRDLFFHPGMRPLPPAPVEPAANNLIPHLLPAGTYRNRDQINPQQQSEQQPYARPPFPVSPEAYEENVLSPSAVPRSTSLSSHTGTPRTDAPIRSKTDADRAARLLKQQLLQQQQQQLSGGNFGGDIAFDNVPALLDLPAIPAGRRKKFNPAKLSSDQFRKCYEPWALSSIVAWVRDLSEDETDLKEQAVVDAIVALFTHKVPTMNIADAETLGARVVRTMLDEGVLIEEEEWVKFGDKSLTGVLFQITGTGCYSSKLHLQETEIFGRCYSHHCMRTLKKVNLHAQVMEPEKKTEDWATFYKVEKAVWESYPKKEVNRQNNLHEIVTTEDSYIGQLDVLRLLYRDQLAGMQPPIISPKRMPRFLKDVFGKVDAVKKVNEDYLLAQLKYRQKEQGPFIAGFSDIFREWIRKAKSVYIDYAATFPQANYLIRKEAERNVLFRQFLNQAREHKTSNRLAWDTYLKSPITRIQRYTLLLSSVHKNMDKESEEKTNLQQAIDEIRIVALECDSKVGEMTKKVDLMELGAKLQLRPEMKKEVELNLEHLGREIIFQGDLQRPGNRTRFTLVDTHAILFDHYLVLAKTTTVRDPTRTTKYETYDVSKLPIPMDLLVLESTDDDPVVKSSVKGITASSSATQANTRTGLINHTNTGLSAASGSTTASGKAMITTTVLEGSKDDKILYPFKIKHLGKSDVYTLYAPSPQNRQDWCEKIVEARTKHAASLYAQNAEPFKLRVLADTAFGNPDQGAVSTSVSIRGTPLDRAIREVEQKYVAAGRPTPVCKAPVNCATVFHQPQGQLMCAVGTDFGVYISEYHNPRGWKRAVPIVRVSQIAVFEEFNLFLLIADKSLIAYHLDVVCPANGSTGQSDSARKAPQKLSGTREVGFFAAGRMKDRTLVLYKKREGISSTFKVLEPVVQKSASTRSRFMPSRRGQTEFFREYDEFYIPTDCYGINLFHSSLAISTSRGVEILTLDKKLTWSVPCLNSDSPEAQAHLTSIGNRIKDLKPLGMFRLSESEFIVAFVECAVYVNKHGDVSRSVVMEFVGRAHTACLCGKFLILFNDDFVEVRNAVNGRMRQVITGRNVSCLDDGGNVGGTGTANPGTGSGASARTVKICMQHPENERIQLILELVENECQKD